MHVALAGVVEHQVEDDGHALGLQRGHRVAQFGDAARAQARVERHRCHRIVTPGIAQAQRRQVALVDPGDDGHQLHRRDVQLAKVGQHRRVRQCCYRAAQLFGHVGVEHGEGADVELVNQATAHRQRRAHRRRDGASRDNGSWDDVGRVAAELRQSGVLNEGAIEFLRVRIDEQLGRIKPVATFGCPHTLGAVAVASAGQVAIEGEVPVVAFALHDMASLALRFEKAERDLVSKRRADSEVGGASLNPSAEAAPLSRLVLSLADGPAGKYPRLRLLHCSNERYNSA
ncbi:hypothetical protein NOVOSPHI9U_20055 [Novosphingobium sp. 9U]|nr:hypothetical protein NOVOSPHI9U_20055 [Novosphingobium sp. 9U]